jgi:hypothetical protein
MAMATMAKARGAEQHEQHSSTAAQQQEQNSSSITAWPYLHEARQASDQTRRRRGGEEVDQVEEE